MIGITHSFLLLCCSEQTCRQKYTYICIYTYVFFFLFFVILFARRSEDFQSFFGTDFFFSIYFYFACKIYNVFSSFIFERKTSLYEHCIHSRIRLSCALQELECPRVVGRESFEIRIYSVEIFTYLDIILSYFA